jgi:predicted RNase H-like HicB family nuclease
VSYGDTLDEARAMAVEAIAAYLEALQKEESCRVPLPGA